MDYKEKVIALLKSQELSKEQKEKLENIFPELKESEEERIRKGLIKAVSRTFEGNKLYGTDVTREEALAWLEKQGEDKEINNFDVLLGLYKCVHRMFDGTPDSKLLFEVGNVYKCLSKHDRAEFEISYGHSVYLEDPVVCKHFIPFEKQGDKPQGKTALGGLFSRRETRYPCGVQGSIQTHDEEGRGRGEELERR